MTKEGKLYYPAQNVLYGSASPITKGVGHVMEVTGCSLEGKNVSVCQKSSDLGKVIAKNSCESGRQ